MDLGLNRRAARLADAIAADAALLGVAVTELPGGARVIDCGVAAAGGLEAGRRLAEICLAGLATVSFTSVDLGGLWLPAVQVDHRPPGGGLPGQPVCRLGHRPAGVLRHGLGTGPQRGARGAGALRADRLRGDRRTPPCWCWRAGRFPTREWCGFVADKCRVRPEGLTAPHRADRAASPAASRSPRARSRPGSTRCWSSGSTSERAERRGRVPARAGGEERPARHRMDERLHPLRHARLLRRSRGRRRGGGDGRATPGLDVAGLRHALLRDLQARRQRLLQDRPDAVQPGGGGRQQPGLRARLPRRPARPRGAAGLFRAGGAGTREARREGRHPGLAVRLARGPPGDARSGAGAWSPSWRPSPALRPAVAGGGPRSAPPAASASTTAPR